MGLRERFGSLTGSLWVGAMYLDYRRTVDGIADFRGRRVRFELDIRNKDGTPLSPERYKEVREVLEGADAGVEHGSVVGWETDDFASFDTKAGQKSYKKMVEAHSEGGTEPLVRIGDGDPKAVWYETRRPRRAARRPRRRTSMPPRASRPRQDPRSTPMLPLASSTLKTWEHLRQ